MGGMATRSLGLEDGKGISFYNFEVGLLHKSNSVDHSDQVSHIDIQNDNIDTVVSHVDTYISTSFSILIWSASISILSSTGQLPHQYCYLVILWTG